MKTNTIIKRLLIILLFTAGLFNVASAQGWVKNYSLNIDHEVLFHNFSQRSDSTFWAFGFNLQYKPSRLLRIDLEGNVLQAFDYDSIASNYAIGCMTPDEGMAIISEAIPDTNNLDTKRKIVMRVDALGNIMWTKTIIKYDNPTNLGRNNVHIDTTNNGGFICTSNVYDTAMQQQRKLVQRLDGNGNVLWSNYFEDSDSSSILLSVKNANDGGFLLRLSSAKIIKIDANGNFEWEFSPSFTSDFLDCEASPFSNSKINFYTLDTSSHQIIGQLDQATGNVTWVKTYPILPDTSRAFSVIQIDTQTFVAGAMVLNNFALSESNRLLALTKLDTSGQVLDFKWLTTSNLGYGHKLVLTKIIQTLDNGYLIGGFHLPNYTTPYSGFLIKTDSNFVIYPNSVTGVTYFDTDGDCLVDNNETRIPGINISYVSSQDSFITRSSSFGEYTLGLSSEIYDINSSVLSPYWSVSACNPSTLDASQHQDTTINLAFESILDLPYITIDAYTRPRWCSSNTYTIEYCNTGTADFVGYIEVNVDTFLQIDSTSIPITNQVGNTLFFAEPLGMGIGACKSFEIYYSIPCNNDLMERTVCFNAHAYNDSIANLNPQWDLSNLELSVDYQAGADSVNFELSNTGSGNMLTPQMLIVIEDNVILNADDMQLNVGEVVNIKVPANGKTWRTFINQSLGNPYAQFTTAFLEGAASNAQTVSTGFVNQFPINGEYAFHYNFCEEILNSYDPNQKTVYPKGLIPNNMIEANVDLEYLLEFQNTGNDVAYVVRIIDTLPEYLNLESILPSVSSHPYTFNFLGNNVVEFLFEGIHLPDSTTNEAESHGFVKFKIKQKVNNPIGTEINNSVGIYFDYNDPVITNIAQVVIGELKVTEIETNIKDQELANLNISCFPNPSVGDVTIKVEGYELNEMSLSIFDMQGKMVHQQITQESNSFKINKADFKSQGVYLFQIYSKEKYIGSGKIVVQ